MKKIDISIFTYIVAIIVGTVMVLWPAIVADYLVFAVGMLFLIPGAVSVIMHLANRGRSGATGFLFPLPGLGSVLFGLLLMIVPSFFANMIAFVLGLSLSAGGLFQIVQLSHARTWTKVSFFAYIVPVMLFVLGIATLFNPSEAKETTFFVIGIGVLVYSVTGIVNWLIFTRKQPKRKTGNTTDIQDAEIVEN